MQIRTRLTLQFLLLGGVIMIIASLAIYFSASRFRQQDFYNRLFNKSRSTAKLLFEAATIDTNLVLRIEKDNPVNLQNERIIVLNFRDDIVYSTDEKNEIEIRRDVLERVRLGEVVTYRQDPFEVISSLYTARLDRFVLIAAATDTDGSQYLEKLRLILTFVCLFSLLLFFIAGWLYSGRALSPISRVVKQVEDISITSLNLRVYEGNGTDEIGRLARTFNRMLERLETSVGMQKDFIANASHELRTPLTSINGQLEVLMMKDRTAPEYKSALLSVLDDIKGLIDISNRLLLIARTSGSSPVNLNQKVRIDEVLWQSQEELLRYHSNYHINIKLDDSMTEADQMIVAGDEYLLKVAVSNIIDNACKYSGDHGVEVTLHRNEKGIEIIFTDRGIGIPEEDRKRIFEPFFRGSNTISYAGSGIGLPLVNQIMKSHNGSIMLSSETGRGTRVVLSFPAN